MRLSSRVLFFFSVSLLPVTFVSAIEPEDADDEAPPPPPEEPPVKEEAPPPPPPTTPAPPPPPPPPPAVEEENKEEIKIIDKLSQASREDDKVKLRRLLSEKVEKNNKMQAAGHHWMLGSWLYGDLAHGVIHEDHLTAHGCADHCEANPECYHWVYYLDNGRCDLKVNGGGHNADVDHMIVGHAKRYLALPKTTPKGSDNEL